VSRHAHLPGVKTSPAQAAPCTVSVCRGCCCGTAKVPLLDHAEQLARLRQNLEQVCQVRETGCLDVCERANVVVVQPSRAGRAAGGRPVWLGLANDPAVADDVIAWVRAGGPGLVDLPDLLDLYAFNPPRRVRRTVGY
jgi:(2Fe-2S) ferredoxin